MRVQGVGFRVKGLEFGVRLATCPHSTHARSTICLHNESMDAVKAGGRAGVADAYPGEDEEEEEEEDEEEFNDYKTDLKRHALKARPQRLWVSDA